LLLAREWSGQAAIDREQATGVTCGCAKGKEARTQAYLQVARKRFDGINRCC
jgi:hypothetical protein